DIPHDPKQPRTQIAGGEEEMRAGQSPLQRVLKQVLGSVGIPNQGERIAAQGWNVSFHSLFKSLYHDYLSRRFGDPVGSGRTASPARTVQPRFGQPEFCWLT